MIIGLCGKAGSGKDTVGAYLVKQYGFERKAFADPLKKSIAALFSIPFSDIDKYKNDPNVEVEIYNTHNVGGRVKTFSFREILQRYGTEAHRDIFGENFWVDQTLPVRGFYAGRKIVVTDVRFKSEADRIQSLGGYITEIKRETEIDYYLDVHKKLHSSEVIDFNVDATILNIPTIDNLFKSVDEILVMFGVNKYETNP